MQGPLLTEVSEISTMVMVAVPVVSMVIVAATIPVCQTTEEAIAVPIFVSSVTSSVSSIVVIAGIVVTVPTVSSVEVAHIVPGGEERSKPRITCNTFLSASCILSYFKGFSSKFHWRHRLYILEIPWIPMMMNIARIAEPSMVFMLLAQCWVRN